MDAAQKLIKTFVPFPVLVVALSLAAPVWAFDTPAFSLSPPSVTCSATSCQDVNVTSTGAPGAQITYSVSAVDYTFDPNTNGLWLGVSPTSGTTPGFLQFSLANLVGLSQGTHTAKVTLTATDASGAAPVTITITYNTGGGGGGGTTLTSSINPITQSVASGNSVQVNPSISTSSQTLISIGIASSTSSCLTANWLSVTNPLPNTISFGTTYQFTVTMNATGLSTQTCQGTITVTPSTGSVLTIPVTMNVNGSGGGTGQINASPNTVNLTFSGGVSSSQGVTVTGSTASNTYNATTNCGGNWLAVNSSQNLFGVTFGTNLTITAGSTANNLSTGNYTCFVNLADPASPNTIASSITVNLSVNGGTATGLTVNPSSVGFSAAVNGIQQQTTLTVTSQSGGVLLVGATSGTGWLTFTSGSLNQTLSPGGSAFITVFANPGGLASNTYTGSLSVQVGQQTVAVPITFTVGGGGSGGTGATVVAPTTLNLTYQIGTFPTFVNQPSIAITGPNGTWTSNISYGSGSGWLSMSPTTGVLPDTNQSRVVANPAGLAAGNYSATITITTTGGTANVTVNLSVTTGMVLLTTPGSAVFFYQSGGALPQGVAVFPSNSDGSALSVTATANDTWVSVFQQSGSNSFSVNADPAGKTSGVYTSNVTVSESSATNNPVSFPVVLVVNGGGGGGGGGSGTLIFSPSSLSFSAANGTTPNSQNLSVSSNVSSTFTVTSSASWLTVSPTAGTTSTNLTVSANPSGLSNNSNNSATLTFNSNGNIQTVGVTFVLGNPGGGGGGGNSGNVNVTCVNSCGTTQPSMVFTAQSASGVQPVGGLSVRSSSGTAPVSFTVQVTTSSGGNWLSTSAGLSTLTTPVDALSVQVNVGTGSSALAAGTYNGNIAIIPTGGTTVNVSVTLTVSAPPTVSASPTQLTFTYRAGDPTPAAQTITVTGNGTALAFTAVASPSGTWLAATPGSGNTPGSVTVSVNPANLTPGTYTGTVTVAGASGSLGNTVVNITLTVTAPLPTVARVVNAASYQANAISPGEIITLFASDAQHPIGPATPAGLTLDSTGKVATTLGGVQVLINGFACPMIFVSATQVSAVAPYEIAPLTSATVLVKFLGQSSNGVAVNVATTSPGLFTLNSSGSGPAAILNQNGSTNTPTNPATRGDTVVIYLTGEGQTSPPGVTGKVTTVSATPPLTPGPLLPISILINGQGVNYSFAGEAPGYVSGVLQLNVTIPANLTLPANGADSSLVVSIGGNSSQSGVTIAIR